MNILAIDTSNTLASVSLLKDDKVTNLEDYNNVTHSERLLKLIDKVLTSENITAKDIDIFMTTNGPGSFTGCRIGVVTIKGLAFVDNKKIIAVSSLESMLVHAYLSSANYDTKTICVIMNAKNDRAYFLTTSIFMENGNIKYTVLHEESNDTLENIFYELEKLKDDIFIVGNMNEELRQRFKDPRYTFSEESIMPSSSYVIEYYQNVNSEIIKSHEKNTFDLDITYARKSQAERIKNGEKN